MIAVELLEHFRFDLRFGCQSPEVEDMQRSAQFDHVLHKSWSHDQVDGFNSQVDFVEEDIRCGCGRFLLLFRFGFAT